MDPISLVTPRTDLAQEPTSARPTPRTGVAFRDVVSRSAGSLVDQARTMMTRLPGGPVLAAAVRGAPTTTALSAPLSPYVTPNGGRPAPVTDHVPPAGTPGTQAANAEGPGGGSDLGGTSATPGIEGTLQSSQDMNLYYLQLQEAMAAENRSYSASSNVLKARHDTVKNAIGNIR